jgi:hypothetical protein
MLNRSNSSTIQFTWQALLWRLLLTLLLLLALAGPGPTIFRNMTNRTERTTLPGLSQGAEDSRWQVEIAR